MWRTVVLLGVIALTGAGALVVIAVIADLITTANVQETAKLSAEAHGLAAAALRNGEFASTLTASSQSDAARVSSADGTNVAQTKSVQLIQ